MRKLSMIVLGVFAFGMIANSQDLTSEKGEPILPATGDWSIGINALPFINQLGNMFNASTSNNNAQWGWLNNSMQNIITGKYVKDETTFYRAKLRLGLGSETNKENIAKSGTTNNEVVEDSKKSSYSNIYLGAGIEKRKGSTRVQGFYGAEAFIKLVGSKDKYTYGNAIDATYNTPARTNFGSNVNAGTYTLEDKSGSTFGIGVNGFIGVEYFFAAKMSIGGEFGWGISFDSTGKGKKTTETWSATAVKSTDTENLGGSTFKVDTGNLNGALMLQFYF